MASSDVPRIKLLAEDLGARMLAAAAARLGEEAQTPPSNDTAAAMTIAGLSAVASVLVAAGSTRTEAYAAMSDILATWTAQEQDN